MTRTNKASSRHLYWSGAVTRNSNALHLESRIFTARSARRIALSLKWSAQRSARRKGTAYQSAMSMINLYINRAGRNLSPARRRLLEGAERALRRAFGRQTTDHKTV